MKTRFTASALVVTSLLAPHIALAAPIGPPPPPACNDFPRMGLEYSLGGFAGVGLDPDLEDELDAHLAAIITDEDDDEEEEDDDDEPVTKGAVLMVARNSKIVYHKAVGLRDGNTHLGGDPNIAMTTDVIFDLESMTKPFTAAVLLEMDADGVLDLDDYVIDYLPDFAYIADPADPSDVIVDSYKSDVTIRDMLRYMGGLDVDSAVTPVYGAPDPYAAMRHEPSIAAPGTEVLYSDLTYRLLAHVAEVAYADVAPTPKTFRQLVWQYVTGPLEMTDTDYEPALTMVNEMDRVAGTGEFSHHGIGNVPGGYRRGEVQDDQDWYTQRNNAMFPDDIPTGAGCDGLFSTAYDLGKFAQALLDNGQVWDPMNCEYVPVLAPATVTGLTTVQTVGGVPPLDGWTADLLWGNKAYGFEISDKVWSVAGSQLSGVFKTGGAGTFLIIDPTRDLFIVLLTNHGLPDMSDFFTSFDEMLEEIGPHRVADSVAAAILPGGSSSS